MVLKKSQNYSELKLKISLSPNLKYPNIGSRINSVTVLYTGYRMVLENYRIQSTRDLSNS